VEFHNDEIEDLQRRIAEKAGYRLVGASFGTLRRSHRRQIRPAKMSRRDFYGTDNGPMTGAATLRMPMRIDRADSEAELLGPPISNREIVQVVAGDFEVRLARTRGRDRCRASAALSRLL